MAHPKDKLTAALRCIEEAEKHHEKIALDWKRHYEVYLGKPDERKNRRRGITSGWRSKVFVKDAFQQVETLLPEFLVESPNFEVVPREQSDQPGAKVMQRLLDYQLDRDRYGEKRMQAVKKAIIFGACPIKVTWSYDVRKMKVRNPMPAEQRAALLLAGEEVPAVIEQDVTLRDDPTMIVVDPFDFMWDPAATSIDDARYVLHRSWLTSEQLKQRADAGTYSDIDKVLNKGESGGGIGDKLKRLWNESEEEQDARRGDRHEVIEKWTRDRLTVIVNRQVIVRDVENPYWHGQIPFVMATTQPDVDKMTGLSEVWSIADLQEMANSTRNSQRDALALTLNPPLWHADPRLAEADFRPGARFNVQGPNQVGTLDIGQTSQYVGGNEVDRLTQSMERMTGINASIAGNSSEGTATEAAMNLRQGKGRIALKVSSVDRAFSRAAEMFIQLNQQFVDADRVLRIAGEEWETVGAQDIAGLFDVKPRNSTDQTVKELAREQSLNALNVGFQLANLGYDIDPLVRKMTDTHELDPLQKVQMPGAPGAPVDPSQPGAPATPDGLDANGFAPDALTG